MQASDDRQLSSSECACHSLQSLECASAYAALQQSPRQHCRPGTHRLDATLQQQQCCPETALNLSASQWERLGGRSGARRRHRPRALVILEAAGGEGCAQRETYAKSER